MIYRYTLGLIFDACSWYCVPLYGPYGSHRSRSTGCLLKCLNGVAATDWEKRQAVRTTRTVPCGRGELRVAGRPECRPAGRGAWRPVYVTIPLVPREQARHGMVWHLVGVLMAHVICAAPELPLYRMMPILFQPFQRVPFSLVLRKYGQAAVVLRYIIWVEQLGVYGVWYVYGFHRIRLME